MNDRRRKITRRGVFSLVGGVASMVGSRTLLGCGNGEGRGPSATVDGGSTGDALAQAAWPLPWATGGTSVLSGKDYGNPFAAGMGDACVVYKESTLGPCHARTLGRQDISEGAPGLPTRLEFLLLDKACKPISNAALEIWHCSHEGLYSGDDAAPMCTSGNAGAMAARYFRGIRTSSEEGRVTFDTCFPGWYKGRTTHIHFTVVADGVATKTSQLFFDDALKNSVFSTHETYKPRGLEDTGNATDGVIAEAKLALPDAVMQVKQTPHGVLLAYKAIVVA